MKKLMNTINYFFTPEDSTAAAGQGNISFDISSTNLNLGSVKALFWVLSTMGVFYLITLI
ncbi:MAG: hypothetical protein MI892_08840 [Desulfobacterales bacterium]|nr:hypothetical protein [Desulfobacterales bacterium]